MKPLAFFLFLLPLSCVPNRIAVAPDGTVLIALDRRGAYHASDPGDSVELFATDLSGGSLSRLTRNRLAETWLAVSPDGKWYLYVTHSSGEATLWIGGMKPGRNGGPEPARELFCQEGEFAAPVWAPESSRVLLYRFWPDTETAQKRSELIVLDCFAEPAKQVLLRMGEAVPCGAWCGDGTRCLSVFGRLAADGQRIQGTLGLVDVEFGERVALISGLFPETVFLAWDERGQQALVSGYRASLPLGRQESGEWNRVLFLVRDDGRIVEEVTAPEEDVLLVELRPRGSDEEEETILYVVEGEEGSRVRLAGWDTWPGRGILEHVHPLVTFWISRRKIGYLHPERQDKLWIWDLESDEYTNFSALLGEAWRRWAKGEE